LHSDTCLTLHPFVFYLRLGRKYLIITCNEFLALLINHSFETTNLIEFLGNVELLSFGQYPYEVVDIISIFFFNLWGCFDFIKVTIRDMNEDHPSLLVPKVWVWGCKPMFPIHNLSNKSIENFDYAPNLFYEKLKFDDKHHICDCCLTPKSGIWIPILQPKNWNLNTWLCRPWKIFHMKNWLHKMWDSPNIHDNK